MITFTKNAIKKLKEAVEPGDYVRVGAAKSECGCGTSFKPEGFKKGEAPAGGCATGGCSV